MDTYVHSRAARVGLAAVMEEPPQPPFFSGVFMNNDNNMIVFVPCT